MKKIFTMIVLLIITFVPIILYINRFSRELKNIGYSDSEIKVIIKNLNRDNINYVLEQEYNKDLVDFVKTEKFNEDELKEYLEYHNKYDFVEIKDVVQIVNKQANEVEYNDIVIDLVYNPNFDITNSERYLKYYQNNPNINDEAIITIVNNDVDMYTLEYDTIIMKLIKGKYFISNNTKRYINYYKKTNDNDPDEIIRAVNSNIDYAFYTNVKEADTTKGNLILVNKYHILGKDFIPENLVTIETKYGRNQLKAEVYVAYKEMWEEANKEGLYLYATSPYRSYSTQSSLYNSYVNRDGKAAADTFSARPGYSEHQTGLAIDIVSNSSNFDTFEHTQEFSWMLENAHKFGFILRYPKDKEYITGYMYEPWHYRYVGVEVAQKIKELDITYEEYYAYFVK